MTLVPRSLRWRLQLWHSLLLMVVLIGFGFTAYRMYAETRYRQLDGELRLRVQELTAHLDRGGPRPPPRGPGEQRREPPPRARGDEGPPLGRPPLESPLFTRESGFYFAVWRRDGEVLERASYAPADLKRPVRSPETVRTRDGFREIYMFTPPGECLLAGVSEAPLQAELGKTILHLTLLGGLVWGAGLLIGSWFTGRSIAPLQEIGATARRIAEGALEERIPPPAGGQELVEVAAILNETFARLEATFREQARFTSDAAHELNTPVSIILGQAQLATSRPRSMEELTEIIGTMRRSAERMKSLIESLLVLSVLDSHAAEAPQIPCDLAELAEEQVAALQPLALERQVQLVTACAPAPCTGDPDRLAQVFTNLLANALKYCRPGDRVCISTGTENGCSIARVADTGPGIAEAHQARLFQRFYRADASRNRTTGGAGLGLAICKSIVGAHHGTIYVEPAPPPGITFAFRIPRTTADADVNRS